MQELLVLGFGRRAGFNINKSEHNNNVVLKENKTCLNICLLHTHTCESEAAFTLIDILIVYILLVNKVMYKCL